MAAAHVGLLVAACGGNDSPAGLTAFTLSLQTDRACYGAHVVVELAGATESDGELPSCSFDASDCTVAIVADGPGFVRRVGRELEICISDSQGFDTPTTLLECELIAPSFGNPPVRVTRALDADLAVIDPAPLAEIVGD